MRTRTSLQRIAFGLFTILIPFVFLVAGILITERSAGGITQAAFLASERSTLKRNQVAFDGGTVVTDPTEAHSVTALIADPSCPLPFVKNKVTGECILKLNTNIILSKPIVLASNTKLNCQGMPLVPVRRGVSNSSTRSQPEVAIFINGAQNVQIRNCSINGFDFGIFAINGKRRQVSANPPLQIFQNKIDARFVGISLMSVDDTEIRGNRLGLSTRGGRAIYVGRDSDRNRILDNKIDVNISTADNTPVFRVPGPELPSNPVVGPTSPNPNARLGSAVLITQIQDAEPTLLNAIIEGKIFQLRVTDSARPNTDFSESNIFKGNTITISRATGTVPVDGVILAIPQGTRVSNNKVVGANVSIGVGIQNGLLKQFPGTCTNRTRFCLADEDCNIRGVDPAPTLSTCTRLPPPTTVSWVTLNSIIQDNEITGPFLIGISTAGEGTMVSDNIITGDGVRGTGIRLAGKFALGNSTVTRNTVKGTAVALNLIQSIQNQSAAASSFLAHVFLNDFTGYSTAVMVSKTQFADAAQGPFYDRFSELSLNGEGNFWGPCPPAFDPSKVRNNDTPPPGTVNSFVKDSRPFTEAVARASPKPTLCP